MSYSHIYCLPCAAALQLTEPPPNGQRTCPAYGTSLSKPDDAVIAVLNPSDDYKTSGLSPSIIIEICTCGLASWTYQVTQEMSVLAPSPTVRRGVGHGIDFIRNISQSPYERREPKFKGRMRRLFVMLMLKSLPYGIKLPGWGLSKMS